MNTAMQRRRSLWKTPALITAIILLIPVVRSLVVNGFDWDVRGFLFVSGVGAVLFGIGLTFQMLTRNAATSPYRAAAAVAVVAAVLVIWVNFVQTADDVNPGAIMYFGVPLVGVIGAAIARFKADGMARAFFATALVHVVVLTIVLTVRNPQVTPWSAAVLRGFGANAFFAALFIGSALLFRRAARQESAPITRS